jgi:hypothetical protein
MSSVTMRELELETAELLPARETLVAGIDPGGSHPLPGSRPPRPGRAGPLLSGGTRAPLSGSHPRLG